MTINKRKLRKKTGKAFTFEDKCNKGESHLDKSCVEQRALDSVVIPDSVKRGNDSANTN